MSATPATTALDAAGIAYTLHPYDHDPANRHFGDEAAAALASGDEGRVRRLSGYLVGKAIAASGGTADPSAVKAAVEARLAAASKAL